MKVYDLRLDSDKVCILKEERNYDGIRANDVLNTPSAVSLLFNDVFDTQTLAEEHVFMLCFDNKLRPCGISEVSKGSMSLSICHAREIFQRALLMNATGIIVAHNHLSGDPEPSEMDNKTCKKLVTAGKLMGVPLLDFIVLGDGKYVSYKERGMISGA